MSDHLKDWITVVSIPAERAETAAVLLALADHPGQVRTVNAGADFLVHPDVAAAYTAPATVPPRRRGRRKNEEESTGGN